MDKVYNPRQIVRAGCMSTQLLLSLAAMAGYVAAGMILWHSARHEPGIQGYTGVLTATAIGLIFHFSVLYVNPGFNSRLLTELGPAISTATFGTALLFLLLSFRKFAVVLGLVVIPAAIGGLIADLLIPGVVQDHQELKRSAGWHIALALPTYGILCLAFAQACILWFQENRLKNPATPDLLPGLPALQSMESSLQWLILAGFILMTVNLISGMISSYADSGRLLLFNHHIILSIVAWMGFGSLLLGRKTMGWRGKTAAKWTIATFVVLVLAFFGTRAVQQLILGE